jgi:uncharacterized membrane protein YphA (DoxX/SURF4 family)
MKTRKVAYWGTTTLLALGFLAGGAYDLARSPSALQTLQHLGYPTYFAVLIGVWKISGAFAILVPGWPRLQEWAYAGMFFDLSGAIVSHAAVGDGVGQWMPPLVFLAFALASWALRSDSRRLLATRSQTLGASASAVERGATWLAS